jgi:hypothetical protein
MPVVTWLVHDIYPLLHSDFQLAQFQTLELFSDIDHQAQFAALLQPHQQNHPGWC